MDRLINKMKETKFYKIRRKSDGHFSTGGDTPQWSKTGKVWKRISDVKSHLTNVKYTYKHNGYLKWENHPLSGR
jgi:hypothetical protein